MSRFKNVAARKEYCLTGIFELGLACSQTQLCQLGVFIDCVEQLHVSAFIGHRQVVLREINKLH